MKIVPSLFRVLITPGTNYQVDLQTGEFADLLGFDKDIVTATSYGAKIPDISRSVDNIFIHKNVISDSVVSGLSSDILCRFSIDNLPLSFLSC